MNVIKIYGFQVVFIFMDPNFVKGFEKFMDSLGITYDIKFERSGMVNKGRFLCFSVEVKKEERTEYLTYHCYKLRNKRDVEYDSGNEVKGISKGILAFYDRPHNVWDYFETKTRNKAKEYFDNI